MEKKRKMTSESKTKLYDEEHVLPLPEKCIPL